MSKRQHGNKEAKKPKKAVPKPQEPAAAAVPAATAGARYPDKK